MASRRPGNKLLSKPMMAYFADTYVSLGLNYLIPGYCGSNFKSVISKHMLRIKFMGTFDEIRLRRMSQNKHIWW